MDTFAKHFAPIRRVRQNFHPSQRRSALLLSYRIGIKKTAYLFGVKETTVYNWRGRIRL